MRCRCPIHLVEHPHALGTAVSDEDAIGVPARSTPVTSLRRR
jgi:hypothetical protein